jgi:D-glycero-D-manno-heptose 1,7-bisphosphate phosphatase
MQSNALFLDRDGVINHNYGYVHRVADFKFVDGIFELTRAASAQKYKIIVITNQAGIARGFYSEQQFHELTDWMCSRFLGQGASIEKVYFSPYHPTEGLGDYKKDDISRKPRPGMILQAQREFGLNLESSVLIGDKPSDIQAGIAAGVGRNLLLAQAEPPELGGAKYTRISCLREALSMLAIAPSAGLPP